jgi:2-keto-myo-inositol isomerase
LHGPGQIAPDMQAGLFSTSYYMAANNSISRRKLLGNGSLAFLGLIASQKLKADLAPLPIHHGSAAAPKLPFGISLNTSTIRAYNLKIEDQIDFVADAGFDGIELWINDITNYLSQGGSLESLSGKLEARGLMLENLIGFAPWYSDDAVAREKGIEQLHHDMVVAAKLGCKYIAAPVQGIKPVEKSILDTYSERYQSILKLSDQTGVVPILELWGHGAISKLAEGAYITISTGHLAATMLLDFYHLYRGGNAWETLDLINCGKLPVIHINDFPGNPPREQLKDADRVFPGDGICPFKMLITKLYKAGFRGSFSVELFNQHYWDTLDVKSLLKLSYEKTLHVIQDSMADIR